MEDLIFSCPHCQGSILVYRQDLHCRIFRHGVYRTTGEPIPPHAPKEYCEQLVLQDMIYGCGKPFQVIQQNDGSEPQVPSAEPQVHSTEKAVECDYI